MEGVKLHVTQRDTKAGLRNFVFARWDVDVLSIRVVTNISMLFVRS